MALNWIVPVRRVVVTNENPQADGMTYRQAVDAWLAQLDDGENWQKLTEWYNPMSREGRLSETGRVAARRSIDEWIERFFAEGYDGRNERRCSPPLRPPASAPPEDWATLRTTRPRFPVRLWKGPYRVLNSGADATTTEDRCEVSSCNGSECVINFCGEVANPGARFFPGDVLEFPIFRFLALCGVSRLAQASFNPAGSFLLGTSVGHRMQVTGVHASEDLGSPEAVPLSEEELEAMENEPETDDDGLEEPRDPDAERRPAFRFVSPGEIRLHDNLLAMRLQLLFNAAVGAYGSGNQVFAGAMQQRAGEEHVHHAAQVCGRPVYARGITYGGSLCRPVFNRIIGRGRRERHVNYFSLWTNGWGVGANLPTRGSLDYLPGGTRVTWAWSCSPCALMLAYYMVDAQGGFPPDGGQNVSNDVESPGSLISSFAQVDRFVETQDIAQSLARILPGQDAVSFDGLPRVMGDPARSRRPAREITNAQLRSYMADDLWCTISIDGHEYSVVCLWPHEKLLRESAGGQGPPLTGLQALYNPLSGRTYNPDGPDGDCRFFLYEAAGLVTRTGLQGSYYCSVFRIKPFRFQEIDRLYIGRGHTSVFIGDEPSRDHIRDKRLLCITRFRKEPVRQLHDTLHAFRPILFFPPYYIANRRRMIDDMSRNWYASRAVPYPTLAEAEGLQRDGGGTHIHPSKAAVRGNNDAMIRRLRPLTTSAGTADLRRAVGEELIQRQAEALRAPRERELRQARMAMDALPEDARPVVSAEYEAELTAYRTLEAQVAELRRQRDEAQRLRTAARGAGNGPEARRQFEIRQALDVDIRECNAALTASQRRLQRFPEHAYVAAEQRLRGAEAAAGRDMQEDVLRDWRGRIRAIIAELQGGSG